MASETEEKPWLSNRWGNCQQVIEKWSHTEKEEWPGQASGLIHWNHLRQDSWVWGNLNVFHFVCLLVAGLPWHLIRVWIKISLSSNYSFPPKLTLFSGRTERIFCELIFRNHVYKPTHNLRHFYYTVGEARYFFLKQTCGRWGMVWGEGVRARKEWG